MNANLRKTIIAGSIAALIALPVWADSDAPKDQSNTPTTTAPGGSSSPTGQGDGAASGAQTPAGAATSGAATSGAADSSGSNSASNAASKNPLHSRTADDLEGGDIVNAAGDKIASIDAVVLSGDRSKAHAVISLGGMLGMGGHTTLVSLDELTAAGENEFRVNATEDELKARPEYKDEGYVELEGDAMIGGAMN